MNSYEKKGEIWGNIANIYEITEKGNMVENEQRTMRLQDWGK